MKIAILVEGETETTLKGALISFLNSQKVKPIPELKFYPADGRIPVREKLREEVLRHLKNDHDAVIALTDVYLSPEPKDRLFKDAEEARNKLREWVGHEKFYAHAAQHEFEAWLIPYWDKIQGISGSKKAKPAKSPEEINHKTPPSVLLKEVFHQGRRRSYSKVRDAKKILEGVDLSIAAAECPQLKDFLNTLLRLCEAPELP